MQRMGQKGYAVLLWLFLWLLVLEFSYLAHAMLKLEQSGMVKDEKKKTNLCIDICLVMQLY